MRGRALRRFFVKAITILQPWAWLIIHGSKRVENRSWRPGLKPGTRFLIHAGQSREWMPAVLDESVARDFPELRRAHDYVFGSLLGSVEFADCVPAGHAKVANEPGATGPLCWILRNPEQLDRPVKFRGIPGLFDVPDGLVDSATHSLPPGGRPST